MSYESWRVETKYPSGVWTDITSFVDTVRAPIDIVRGRDTWRDDITPSRLSLLLRNADQRFSPGNMTSAYALRSAQEIRVADRWGGVEYPLFHGSVELPAIDEWQKSDAAAPRDQSIAVSAVDKLGRLERTHAFVSTLTEHILAHEGQALSGYWTYGEVAEPFLDSRGNHPPVARVFGASYSGVAIESGQAGITPQGGGTTPGDDLDVARIEAALGTSGGLQIVADSPDMRASSINTPMAAGDFITLIAWFNPDLPQNPLCTPLAFAADESTIFVNVDPPGGLTSVVAVGTMSGSVDGRVLANGIWTAVAVRYCSNPATLELWMGNDRFVASLSGTPSGADAIFEITAPQFYKGSIGHLQLYIGPASAWGYADFLEQVRVGYNGHERQSVRDRVELILSYAGVDAMQLQLDPTASTPMQRARLAGRTPAQVLAEAVETEQALLFTSARDHGHLHGDVVLHARQRRYNPPLAATVDLSWLEPPLSFRTDPPINDMSVSRVGAGTARAQHTASVDEFGVYAGSATLDTAIDADPANLAAFTVRQHAAPRQRIPRLVLHLRETTDPARAATILGRELGDQVALSGLPANAPWDVGRFHIEGIRHSISVAGHRVEWNTGPVVGDIPGVPTPYPLVGVSVVRAETKIPY